MGKIAVLGPAGSHSHDLGLTMGDESSLVLLSSFGLAKALREGSVERVLLPVENSIEGRVKWVLDLLVQDGLGYSVVGEAVWNVVHCLMGFGKLDEVRSVLSIPIATGQCRGLVESLARATTQDTDSTSAAVKRIAEAKDPRLAAIGTRLAARIYDVPVLKDDIGDDPNNQTRFIVLGKTSPAPTGNDKTSIVFGVQNYSGALVAVLEVLKVHHINMTMIFSEQSPARKLGGYIFFVDVGGHREDRALSLALELIAQEASFFKVLGSYPCATCAANPKQI